MKSGVELGKATNLFKSVTVTKSDRSRLAKLWSNRAGLAGNAVPLWCGYLNLLVVLDEELGEFVLLELRHDSELFACIDRETFSVKVLITHAVWVVVATIGVAVASKAIVRVCTATARRLADVVLIVLARVRRKRKGMRIGLPDINLGAAASVRANTSVGIIAGFFPALNIGLAADEFEVTGALGVAVLFILLEAVDCASHVGGLPPYRTWRRPYC